MKGRLDKLVTTMPSGHLTTGQAAAILSVTSDTVLKWIRSGRLPALRTAGGHHRILRRDLDLLIACRKQSEGTGTSEGHHPVQYCWEFYGEGSLAEECRGCSVFLMRAGRCYEVQKLAPESGHLKAHCRTTCEECEYYHFVRQRRTSVLVVTSNEALASCLLKEADDADFNLEVADGEYSCAQKIADFRPDFAVIDCSIGRGAAGSVARHLIGDKRAPLVRIVLAGCSGEFPEECDKLVFARMGRPFGIGDIDRIVRGFGSGKGSEPDSRRRSA